MKKGLKEKQLSVEIDKLKTLVEMKQGDDEEKKKLRDDQTQFQKREKDLKEEVMAWRELLDAKDEEIDTLNERIIKLKTRKEEGMSAPNSNSKQNIRKDHIIMEEGGKSATCSSNDCVIF